jgi:hypothetical protein
VNPLLSLSIFGVLMSEYFAAFSTKSSFIITTSIMYSFNYVFVMVTARNISSNLYPNS